MPVPLSEEVFRQIFKQNYGELAYNQSSISYAGAGQFFSQEHGLVGVECLWSTSKPQIVEAVPSKVIVPVTEEVPSSVITDTSQAPNSDQESANSPLKKLSAHVKKNREKIAMEIQDICKNGLLSKKIEEKANNIYANISGVYKLGGSRGQAMSAACVYIACREEGVPRSLSEVSEFSGQKRNHLAHCFTVIRNRMDMKLKKVTATDYIIRIGATLNLPEPVRMAAVSIASKANELNLVAGRSPVTVAVGATFMAIKIHKRNISPYDVADIGGVSMLAMKTVYQVLLINVHNLLPVNLLSCISLDSLSEF